MKILRTISNKTRLALVILIGVTLSAACSYDSEKAILNGDVVNMHGPVYNFDRFETFLEQIGMAETATVRITNYTLEGNPTFYNVSFDGSTIDLEIDRSKDKNKGNTPAKMNMSCTDLAIEDGQQVITYTLEGCDHNASSEGFTLLSVLKEIEHSDSH
ncbi:DUF4362 domain-containing protein [Sporosarcina sp. FSL K6-1522]|uniref:DUF4362 domain-containing protein n=1 Tax=Sporosarcina sp. FSL K6-1522 TaxID=2921554 RepID=UPI00315B2DF4